MKKDKFSDLDKVGFSGFLGRDEEPPSRISGLQLFVLLLLLILIGIVAFS